VPPILKFPNFVLESSTTGFHPSKVKKTASFSHKLIFSGIVLPVSSFTYVWHLL